MRELKYGVEGKAANLRTFAVDEPGVGGACHLYSIEGFDALTNPSMPWKSGIKSLPILFQNGPINADGNGVNGIQNEDLLAILIDRLKGFQNGPYACKANRTALAHLETALDVLQERTRERIGRGVEGTHTV